MSVSGSGTTLRRVLRAVRSNAEALVDRKVAITEKGLQTANDGSGLGPWSDKVQKFAGMKECGNNSHKTW